MSDRFFNPYQFIPLSKSKTKTVVSYKSVQDLKALENKFVRHDFWNVEGFSGRLICQLATKSAVFVGAEQSAGCKKTSKPGVANIYCDSRGNAAIPANSLRGMIGNITEIISHSALRVLMKEKDAQLSVRKPAKGGAGEDAPLSRMGILVRQGCSWKLRELGGAVSAGSYQGTVSATQQSHNDAMEENKCFQEVVNDYSEKVGGAYYVRGTGGPRKFCETYFPIEALGESNSDSKLIEVPDAVIDTLESLLRERYDAIVKSKDSRAIKALLPVGYLDDANNRSFDSKGQVVFAGDMVYFRASSECVKEISYSRIWRRRISGNVRAAFKHHFGENSLPWGEGRQQLTAAEALLGVVEENSEVQGKQNAARNLASRVRFYDAISTSDIQLHEATTLKALSSPKLPCPVMYFCASGTYVEMAQLDLEKTPPNGRKVYLPHPHSLSLEKYEDGHWKSNSRDAMRLICRPIPKDETFSFEVHFENLSSDELGLLITAIQPTGVDQPFLHRLGLGKPVGLGHVQLNVVGGSIINRHQRYSGKPSDVLLSRSQKFSNIDSLSSELIDSDSLAALCEISNPENIGTLPVCYPYADPTSPHSETDGYRWFENNKSSRRPQVLERSSNSQSHLMKPLKAE